MPTPDVASPPAAYAPAAPIQAADPTAARAPRARLDAVDLLRGLVMVIMLLDHTRDFVHEHAFAFDPLDAARTTVPLFFTRWITHFCAPIFVFLAGASVYFQRRGGKTVGELRRFLVTRGLWLVLLEVTVVRWGAFFDVDYRFLAVLQVIWAIGVSMIVLAALVSLPTRAVGAIGVAIVALHNLLDPIRVAGWNGPESPVPSVAAKLWMVLHQQGPFPVAGWPSPVVFVLYPVLAWIGVMAAGYAFGEVYDLPAERRRRALLRLGLTLCALFVALRLADVYGDPLGWQATHPRGPVYAALTFLNVQKYPPSLLFTLMTLGPGLLLLGALEGRLGPEAARRAPARWLITFGRVPMFYYLLQWPTARLAGLILSAVAGKATWIYFVNPLAVFMAGGPPEAFGFPLWVVYACWIGGLLLLYPLCRWYANLKATRPKPWMSYL